MAMQCARRFCIHRSRGKRPDRLGRGSLRRGGRVYHPQQNASFQACMFKELLGGGRLGPLLCDVPHQLDRAEDGEVCCAGRRGDGRVQHPHRHLRHFVDGERHSYLLCEEV